MESQQKLDALIQALLASPERERRKRSLAMVASDAMNAVPKVLFLHILKTAGTSFDLLAESVYGQRMSLRRDRRFDVDEGGAVPAGGGSLLPTRLRWPPGPAIVRQCGP